MGQTEPMQALRRPLAAPQDTAAKRPRLLARAAGAALLLPALVTAAGAQTVGDPTVHAPHPWQIGMQAAFSPVERSIHSLNTLVTWIIILITVFVAGLLAYVMWRFSAKRHPVAGRTSHNTVLEVAWTVIPVLILVVIAIPASGWSTSRTAPRIPT